ncbi:glycosyltransferase family 4 protein [Moellerella wisconsensis]|uniref:glycosyltransferase family 4 protein n=1 Tax=Moellerella wisconsensis TaxID=158849 RepID=UPI0025AFD5D9|nr:glycosyltransferase family 4 protein [Moellerella wisconsensis]WJW81225.1 glycosyltransferase family 4 protein [Moellerella wisconsensis]
MITNNKKKDKSIILVTKEYPPQLGGAGIIASNIVASLKQSNIEVILITSSSKLWFLSMYMKLMYFKFKKNKTIIINDVGAMYIAGITLSKKEISKSILWLHGSEKDKAFKAKSKIKKTLLFNKINLKIFRNVKFRVYVSDFLKNKFSDINYSNGNSIIIPNSISNIFLNINDNNKIKNTDGKIRILTVSRIVKEKGYLRFLEAFKNLPDNYIWTIVGDGPDLGFLKEKIENNNVTNRIFFLGKKTQEQLISLYNTHDIFVLLSNFEESFGLVYIEALYCGLPVLATNKGALTNTLQDLHGVSFIDSSDDESIINEKLINLLEIYQYPNMNKKIISQKFSDNTFLSNLRKII